MDDTQEPVTGKVVDIRGRLRRRDEAFLELVDEVTRQLHFAIRPIRLTIAMAREDHNLPPLE